MINNYKGIVLAGGSGSRLHPITKGVSKHLLPIYDKPMIYYPISVLMLAGIREILVITTPDDMHGYQRLIGSGSDFGIEIEYAIQPSPDGLAQAFLIGKDFIGDSNVAMVLGDNIFYGQNFTENLKAATYKDKGATIFGYHVKDPERFGVVDFDTNGKVTSIEEKPKIPKSNFAVTGLYFYDNEISKIAKQITPSARGELEISDINQFYLQNKSLDVYKLGRGYAWLDAGTNDNLLKASQFVKMVEELQGLKIGCPEEIAWRMGFISDKNLDMLIASYKGVEYADYLRSILKEK